MLPIGARVRSFARLPLLVADLTPDEAATLRGRPGVVAVEPDARTFRPQSEAYALVGGSRAYTAGFKGTGALVAVIDTGIDSDHPDLASSIVGEACFVDDNGCPNGAPQQFGPGAAEAAPAQYHGSHVAGIITSDGLVAPRGLAPDAGIVAVNVFGRFDSAYTSDIIAAIDYVVTNYPETDAINLSLGGGAYPGACDEQTPALAAAVDAANAAGIAVVAAAGNYGVKSGIAAPACLHNAIAVGAVYDSAIGAVQWTACGDPAPARDEVACFSQSSPEIDLLAPGVRVVSDSVDGTTATASGTSMATPYVAAAIGLLRSTNPSLTPGAALARLAETGTPVTDAANGLTRPRIDVASALGVPPDRTPPAVSLAAPALTNSPAVAVTLTAEDADGVAGYLVSESAEALDPGAAAWLTVPPTGVQLSPGDGRKVLYARAMDSAGNVSPPAAVAVTLDTTPPSVAIAAPAFSAGEDIPVTWQTGGEPTAYYVSSTPAPPAADDPAWQASPPPSVAVPPGDGSRRVYAWARDAAGNITRPATATTIVDTRPPTARVAAPPESVRPRVSVQVHGSDARGIAGYFASATGNAPRPDDRRWSASPDFDLALPDGDGTKKVYGWTRDLAGNISAVSVAEVRVDSTAAEPVLEAPATAGSTRVEVTLRVHAPRLVSGYFVGENPAPPAVDGDGWLDRPPVAFVLSPGEGRHTIYGWTRDVSGRLSRRASATVVLDTTPPSAVLAAPGVSNRRTVAVTAQARDTTGVIAYYIGESSTRPSLSDRGWRPAVRVARLSTGDGLKRLHLWARDGAGNVSAVATASVLLDTRPPAARIDRATPAGLGAAPIVLSGSAGDAGSGVDAVYVALRRRTGSGCSYWSGSAWTSRACGDPAWIEAAGAVAWSVRLPALPVSGRYEAMAYAVDRAGNVERRLQRGRNAVALPVR